MRCSLCGFDNPDTFVFCGQCGRRLDDGEEDRQSQFLAGERCPATILFAHVVGLASLPEHLDLEDARFLVDACLETVCDPIYRYGGTLDKFVGQEIMAIFGAPDVHEDDAERALRVALEMERGLERFNEAHAALLPDPLFFCCGVNTGLVFAGKVGAPKRKAYTVMGDVVNLANRLAYLAEPGRMLVGESTYRQTSGLFYFHPLDPIRVRGKLEPVPIYLLEGERGISTRSRQRPGLSSILVGRTEEMNRLRDSLCRLHAGQGGVVSVVGDAGLGKSRLVAEARSLEPGLRWVEGRCLSYSSDWPLAPFHDLMERWVGVDDRVEDARGRVWEALEQLMPDRVGEVYPFLLRLSRIQPAARAVDVLAQLSAEGLYVRTLAAVRAFLSALSADRPTVVVMEDLHWADRSSVDMLRRLLPLALDLPLLFLLVSRPMSRPVLKDELRHRLREAEAYVEIPLSPLSRQATQTLIVNLLQAYDLPADLETHVLARGEGNPLFVREIIQALIQQEALVRDEAGWQLTRAVDAAEIPDNLRGLLAGRIGQLGVATRDTLARAAVIGRVFSRQLLERISADPSSLDDHLQTLRDERFIRPYVEEEGQGRAYIFDHGLICEAVYDAIPLSRRTTLHRKVLAAMEMLYQDAVESHCGALAHHAYSGKMWESAARYLHLSGDRAKGAGAFPEAIDYYHRAIDVIQAHDVTLDRKRLADLYHECATVHTMAGEYGTARDVSDELLRLGRETDDPCLRGHALHSAAVVAGHTGDVALVVRNAERAREELAEAGMEWSRGVVLLTLAQAQVRSGELDAAQKNIEQGLRLVGDRHRWPGYNPRGEAAYYAGLIALLKGDLEDAVAALDQARTLAARAGEQLFVALSYGFSGLAHAFRGAYPLALERLETGTEVGRQADLLLATHSCLACAAWTHGMVGRYGTALRLTDFAVGEHQVEFRDARAIAMVARGDALIGLHDAERALVAYQQALQVAGLSHVATVPTLRGIGLAYLRLGQIEQGLASLENAVEFATFGGLRWFRAQALRDLIRGQLHVGGQAPEVDRVAELLDLVEGSGYAEMVGWAHLLHGLVAGTVGDLERALQVGQSLDCLPLVWEAGEALAGVTPRGRAAAAAALETIADDLPAVHRKVFLSRERVRSILSEKPLDHKEHEERNGEF
ncbi:MAG: AAA family ATPase [Anaerolineae bacterium]